MSNAANADLANLCLHNCAGPDAVTAEVPSHQRQVRRHVHRLPALTLCLGGVRVLAQLWLPALGSTEVRGRGHSQVWWDARCPEGSARCVCCTLQHATDLFLSTHGTVMPLHWEPRAKLHH